MKKLKGEEKERENKIEVYKQKRIMVVIAFWRVKNAICKAVQGWEVRINYLKEIVGEGTNTNNFPNNSSKISFAHKKNKIHFKGCIRDEFVGKWMAHYNEEI